tara:strand:- start:395972 stop:396436 length:465 start_codon:yes stop_codon:yes gene_type:complete
MTAFEPEADKNQKMKLSFKVLIWFIVSFCFTVPIYFWSILLSILLFDEILMELDFYSTAFYIILLGAAGIIGIVSLISITLGQPKLLLNKKLTLLFLVMGITSVIIAGYNLLVPVVWANLYQLETILLIYLPLGCTAWMIYIFRDFLGLPKKSK